MNQAAASPAVTFLLFTVASFLMLRYALRTFAQNDRARYAAPVMIFVGVVSGTLFFRMQLGQYYIWFLMIIALIIFSWHAKSRLDDKKILELAGKTEAPKKTGRPTMANKDGTSDIVQHYTMTRRLLSFGLVSYIAAFSGTFYYLFTAAN